MYVYMYVRMYVCMYMSRHLFGSKFLHEMSIIALV